MSFKLEKDVDFAWVSANFGSGTESYKITRYTIPLMMSLLKKHGHRKKNKKYDKGEYDMTDGNALAMRQESICIVLLDWKEGVIQDKNGKNVLCGEKEKKQLVINSPARVDWILSQAVPPKTFFPNEEQEAKNSDRPLNIESEASVTKSNSRTAESVST